MVKRWTCRRSSLHDAVRQGNRERATRLLDKGASLNTVDAQGLDPLHLAISCHDVGMVQLLVLRGADVEALGPGPREGRFSSADELMFLAIQGVQERGLCPVVKDAVISYSWAASGSMPSCSRGNHTPLEYAAITNQPGVIDVLAAGGVNLSRRYGNGYTALHFAARSCSVEATVALLQHGADINAEYNKGHTALYLAALLPWREGAAGVVDALLRRGADETSVDVFGQTAMDRYEQVSNLIPQGGHLAGEVERVGKAFLDILPTTRAWRRRRLLVLYRAHPDRVQVESCSRNGGESASGEGVAGGTPLCGKAGGDLAGVVARVVGLGEEGVFRTIVGYL